LNKDKELIKKKRETDLLKNKGECKEYFHLILKTLSQKKSKKNYKNAINTALSSLKILRVGDS